MAIAKLAAGIAFPTPLWLSIAQMSLMEFAQVLKQWAGFINLKRFCSAL
ncbi:MAG: hypothetical protein AAFO76_11740 [Cyanobacteria bacterium J06607_15]